MKMNLSQTAKFSDVIQINVGGTFYITTSKTLKSVPDTRLSNISKSSAEYAPEVNAYFFDRNPELFNTVLDFYRTGELHLPKHVCGAAIRNELEFWQITSGSISDCCVSSLFKFEDELEVTNNLKDQFEANGFEYTKEEIERSKWNRAKDYIWKLLDKPSSSRHARIFSLVYFVFVLTTCITFILGTHKHFRTSIDRRVTINDTHDVTLYTYLMMQHGNTKLAFLWSTQIQSGLEYLNAVCTIFFFTELVLRLIATPNRKCFFKNVLNIIDALTVLSMIISFMFYATENFNSQPTLLWIYIVAKGFVILRLLRLFRLAKHYSGLKILYLALKASFQELVLLFLTFLIATSLFGALVYYAEFFTSDQFENVPIAIWWAIVTLTTVGYGDFYPVSFPGYIVGSACGMCGLLLLSMPIAIIATNFNDYYSRNKIREKQLNRKKDLFNKLKRLFMPQKNAVSAFHMHNIEGSRADVKADDMAKITENGNAETITQPKRLKSAVLNLRVKQYKNAQS